MAIEVEEISIKSYKSIWKLDYFELSAINILIGANGAGKSNFLSFFTFLVGLANERLQISTQLSDGADTFLYFGRKISRVLSFKVTLKSGVIYEADLAPTRENHFILTREKLWTLDNQKQLVSVDGSPSTETRILHRSLPVSLDVAAGIDRWVTFHLQDTSESSPVKGDHDIEDNYSLKPDAKNLAAILYRLQNHQRTFYDRIVNTIRLVAPFFGDFVLRPNPVTGKTVRLRWRHRDNDDDFDVTQLSDGTLRFICLTTLLLQPNPPSLIIIDEPELGLHPYAITLLAAMLQSASAKSQIIVSTQSVELINEFQPEDIVVADYDNGQSTFRRLKAEELTGWLEDYKLGELWTTNLFGGRP